MKFGSFSSILSTMFTDQMDIYHYDASQKNSDGTTKTVRPSVPTHSNVACRLSFKSTESPQDSKEDENPVRSTPKVFCALQTELLTGDFVVVRRMSETGIVLATYKGTVGLPSIYPTHKEALFNIKESA